MAAQSSTGTGQGDADNLMRGLSLSELPKITTPNGNILFKVINNKVVGTISPEIHSAEHLPNGSDPLDTDVPVATGISNSEGTANSFSRSDHVHDMTTMVGATAFVNGIKGVVPAPQAGNQTYFLRGDGTWSSGPQGNPAAFVFFADSFDNPVTSDWAVNSLSPVEKDNVNNSLNVRSFDDTTEEGVGWLHVFPANTSSVSFKIWCKAKTAPVSTQAVVLKLYYRKFTSGSALPSWSNTSFLTISIPTNVHPSSHEVTINYSTLGGSYGDLFQFELTRDTSSVSDTLSGDFFLISLIGASV